LHHGVLRISPRKRTKTSAVLAAYAFPDMDQLTVSIGFTDFDKNLSMDELINQADNALYYCKTTTRNAVHSYQDLVAKKLIPKVEAAKAPRLEIS
jgi:GGDEF domain-containing protein